MKQTNKQVKEGDIVTMCSATFGDEMWSCRGVGLTRVLAAIKVRSGPVRLVFESPNKYKETKKMTAKQIQAKQEAAAAAQRKKDALLQELEQDEKVGFVKDIHIPYITWINPILTMFFDISILLQRLNKKWFGLF